jgi:hypothetical protein
MPCCNRRDQAVRAGFGGLFAFRAVRLGPTRSTKGEIVASLLIKRLRRRFVCAAELFPFVRLAAIRRINGNGRVTGDEWRGLLEAPAGAPSISHRDLVLIDGKEWLAGCYVKHHDYDATPECIERNAAAAIEVDRLSELASLNFDFRRPAPRPPLPQLTLGWEWLRTVLEMPFVEPWESRGLQVREVPGNFFSASAKAIEELATRQGPPPAVATKQIKGNAAQRKTRMKRSDPKADKEIAEAYTAGGYLTEAAFATKRGISEIAVHRARDRHRHRQMAKEKARRK